MITAEISRLVEKTCRRKSNHAGYGAWTYHFLPVVRNAKVLAKKLGADEEILEIAALFHDYASVLDKKLHEEHHLHSARLAEEWLQAHDYPQEKIALIKQCILNHRSSLRSPRKTVEEKILADADNLAHFENICSLLYLAYVRREMTIEEGRRWVLGKLQRDWENFELPESRQLASTYYEAAKQVLGRKH